MNLIFWIWCLPQSLLGLILYVFYVLRKKTGSMKKYKLVKIIFVFSGIFSGASLGAFILLNENFENDEKTIKHEYGHTVQGFILGPLYLVIIGLPSFCRNIWWRIKKLSAIDYYRGYPENWADKLGGVKR